MFLEAKKFSLILRTPNEPSMRLQEAKEVIFTTDKHTDIFPLKKNIFKNHTDH